MNCELASYFETQYFRQKWLWGIILMVESILFIFIFPVLISAYTDNFTMIQFLFVILIWLFFIVVFPLWIFLIRLDTQVRSGGIFLRFRYLHINWIVLPFSEITKAESITYNPLRDYGGWGIRYGPKGKAYNVHGNYGVLLTLIDGKKILIGSQDHLNFCSSVNQFLC